MKAKDRVDKDTGTSRCVDEFEYSTQMHHLAESGNEHKNNSYLGRSVGILKKKSIETESQQSSRTGRGCNSARREGLNFTR